MELTEIYSCPESEGYGFEEYARLGRVLFQASSIGFSLPSLDVIMTCNLEKIHDAGKECKGDHCYMLFSLGSSPESGFVELANSYGFKLTAGWSHGGKSLVVRVTKPRLAVTKAICREDILKMRLLVDGKYYVGHQTRQLLRDFFPES